MTPTQSDTSSVPNTTTNTSPLCYPPTHTACQAVPVSPCVLQCFAQGKMQIRYEWMNE